MITLHLAQLLADEGFGTLDTDIFWEDIPLNSNGDPIEGIWVVTRGAPISRFNIAIQSFDIYARYANKITTHQKLEAILEYFWELQGVECDLPAVPPYSTATYTNIRILPTSSVESVGSDEQDKIVKVISGDIRYKKGN